jgi:hypothetical protein
MSEHQALAEALRAADLAEGRAASVALDCGGKLERVCEAVVSRDLIATYRGRAEHTLALPGMRWQALAGSTFEFVEHLDEFIGATGQWLRIDGAAGTCFLVFRLLETGAILGCLRADKPGHE